MQKKYNKEVNFETCFTTCSDNKTINRMCYYFNGNGALSGAVWSNGVRSNTVLAPIYRHYWLLGAYLAMSSPFDLGNQIKHISTYMPAMEFCH